MLAELAARIGRLDDAEALLTRAIELAPGFLAARQNMVMLHLRKQRVTEALAEAQSLREAEPDNPAFINLEGVALAKIGDYTDAVLRFEAVLKRRPKSSRIWLSYGHSLKTLGRSTESVGAYRRAIELQPSLGEAWWSLARPPVPSKCAARFFGTESISGAISIRSWVNCAQVSEIWRGTDSQLMRG